MNKFLAFSTICLLCTTIFLSSQNVNVKSFSEKQIVSQVFKDGTSLDLVQSEFQKIESKEDKILIHKLWTGSYLYLKNTDGIAHTAQFDPILGRVQSAYSWKREKYPDFTDAVSEYLLSEGYDEPRELSSRSDKLWFAEIFKGLMEATKYE